MKRIRFTLFLPLLHLALVIPPMLIREAKVWQYAPIAQQVQDYERMHPADTPGFVFEPCYEYRASNASRIIWVINLPIALLIGTPDECPRSVLERASDRARFTMPVKSRIVLHGSLILIGVIAQWWFIGRWLDHRRRQQTRMLRWGVPVGVITAAGAMMVPTAFFSGESAFLINSVSGVLALLAWIILLGMFLASGVAWGIKKIGRQDPNVTHSRA